MRATARPYKEAKPARTIARIRTILAEHDILPFEQTWYNPYPHTFSVRLTTGSEYGFYGTNGKGLDRVHCLASAYAEFMERLQNNAYLFDTSRKNLIGLEEEFGFHFYPDERLMYETEYRALPETIVRDLMPTGDSKPVDAIQAYFEDLEAGGRRGCVAVPFIDLSSGQQLYLPYDQMVHTTGSNGMAAGNTPDEALAVGLFEVMERWAAAEVFFKQLTPPTIPLSCLDGLEKNQEIVSNIQADGYEVTIKDFSVGKGLPVIGVLALDRRAGMYKLAIGCDSDFETAVARCLTEAYQGIANKDQFSSNLSELSNGNSGASMNIGDLSLEEQKREFNRFMMNHQGRFPKALFDDQASYQVDPTPFIPQPTFKQELAKWVGHLNSLGKQVLVRDVSFLGFPSYYIYVPGVSAQLHESRAQNTGLDPDLSRSLDRAVSRICDTKVLEADQLADVASVFDALPSDYRFAQVMNLEFDEDSGLKKIPVSFFATAIWYGLRRFDNALRAIDRYLATVVQQPDSDARLDYYLAVRSWISGKMEGLDDGNTESRLRTQGYESDLINTVRDDMSDPDTSLHDLPLPKCPHCQLCSLRPSCISGGNLDLARRVYPAYTAAGSPSPDVDIQKT